MLHASGNTMQQVAVGVIQVPRGGIYEWCKAEQRDCYTDWWGKPSSAWALSLCGDKTGAVIHRKAVSIQIVFVPILTSCDEAWVMTEI